MVVSFNEFCNRNNINDTEGFWNFVLDTHFDKDGKIIWNPQDMPKDIPYCEEQSYKDLYNEFNMDCCKCDIGERVEGNVEELLDEIISG